jgi:hypothetical protein
VVSATAQSQNPGEDALARIGPMWMVSDPAVLTGEGVFTPRALLGLSKGLERKRERMVRASARSFVSTQTATLYP